MPKAPLAKAPVKPKARPKKANGYKFPEKLPLGEVLKDTAKHEWKLGTAIGQGGFGEIYSASAVGSGSATSNDSYVIKIEPHENGPLFVEKNFYIKIARPEEVETWKKKEGIKILGIPTFYGSGSHDYNKDKYRFIVIERYGRDLWNLFLNNKKKFPAAAVYKCAIQIIDVLHYIHDRGYVHGDIKGANLLLGLKKGTENNVFLVDFGLACKYNTKEFKKDPKKAHNGTIEYTSRDWHIGVPTRRGDMEILGFNLLHWLGSTLPWEKDISVPEKVYEKKRDLMEHAKDYLKKNFPHVPKVISLYLDYVFNLKHDEAPDYKFCKELFSKELKNLPGNVNGKLEFSANDSASPARPLTPKRTPRGKRKSVVSANDSASPARPLTPKRTPRGKRKSVVSNVSDDEIIVLDCDSDDIFADTPSPKKIKKKVTKPATKTRVKKDEPPKPSWRDAPTIKASNIVKAGEYIKKDLPIQRRSKK